MKLSEDAEELLEKLWADTVDGEKKSIAADELDKKAALKQLAKLNYVLISDGEVKLTSKGAAGGRQIVRRHRLAERLLHDVLEIGEEETDTHACKFEHIISEGVEESICTLLGHPRVCPHGKGIPPGECCTEEKEAVQRIVSPLSKLKKGKKGKICYILTENHKNLRKLLAMGVLPGMPIEVIQTYPSHVFQVRQTQIAVNADIADNIFVRATEETHIL